MRLNVVARPIAALTALAVPTVMFATVTAEASNPNYYCNNTAATPYTTVDDSIHIVVDAGASCYLLGATVKSIHAQDAVNVNVIDTEVAHNIMVMGTERNTVIASSGCRLDPHAGNNIMVKDSHNVTICWMSTDNNIAVMGNDGRVVVNHNTAGNNILVMNNDAYAPKPSDTHPERDNPIRMFWNTADNHIMAKNNSGRPVLAGKNVPRITP